MVKIALTRGHVAIVDDIDADLADLNWCANEIRPDYVRARRWAPPNRTIQLHRTIGDRMGIVGEVDHINRNPLDNRRSNLRQASRRDNARNRGVARCAASGYKGVSWNRGMGRWQASIKDGPRNRHLGYYSSALSAAIAYDIAAIKSFGEFAATNYPRQAYGP